MSGRLLPLMCCAAALLAGCATYDTTYDFGKRPTGAVVPGPKGRASAGRVEATVLGVRGGRASETASIDVKVRVERFGDTPVAVPADGLRLLTGDREPLTVRSVKQTGPVSAASGGAMAFEATFSLPGRDPGVFNLTDLDLMVPVDVAGRRETLRIGFQRGATAYLWVDPWDWAGTDYVGRPTGWRQ